MPAAAGRQIRARSRIRASLLRKRANTSSGCRSSKVKLISVAGRTGLIAAGNHDSRFSDSGYYDDVV